MSVETDSGFQALLAALAGTCVLPDGTACRVLTLSGVADAALDSGLALAEVESAALDAGIVPERYLRNLRAMSPAGQARLLRSSAAMVGLGGLGGSVLEALARAGVGRIAAADGDVFAASNLNRQVLAKTATLGLPKTAAAAARVRAVNPAVELVLVEGYLDERGMEGLLAGAGLALDCLGGLRDRPLLQRAAARAGIPLVTGAVAGWTGWVATVLPGARGPADLLGTGAAAENVLGTPAPAVLAVAALQAAEALRLLSGEEPALAGRMLLFDLAGMTFEKIVI